MRRFSIVSGILLALWIIAGGTQLYGENIVGGVLGFLTGAGVFLTILYYGLRVLIYVKSRLLWRVRRRLIITYLFVGLTPITLLTLFGLISSFTGSAEAIARIVAVQIIAAEEWLLSDVRAVAESADRQPAAGTSSGASLPEHARALRVSQPGLRVAVWRSAGGAGATTRPADVTSIPDGSSRLESADIGAPLPKWFEGKSEWSGLVLWQKGKAWRQSLRAVVQRPGMTVLAEIPLDSHFAKRLTDITGITIRPPEMGEVKINVGGKSLDIEFGPPDESVQPPERRLGTDGSARTPARLLPYPIIYSTTRWDDGSIWDFWIPMYFDWSFGEASKQLLGNSELGQRLRVGLVGIGITFLVLELLALIVAAFMTRAVTGTVHELQTATEHIKEGNFNHRARVRSKDQLGELAEAFNDMAEHIEMLLEERVERERLEREVEIAAEVQAKLFPRVLPRLSTLEIAAECRAARGVAGDYYDCLLLSPDCMMLALGDVSGKGLSASLVMSNLQASFRSQATLLKDRPALPGTQPAIIELEPGVSLIPARTTHLRGGGTVARMTTVINEQLCQSTDANRYATLFLALYDNKTHLLHYTNAGHNAAVLVNKNGSVERLSRGGMMVGAFDWALYEEASTSIDTDAVLLVFSDGISEARSPDGEEYGEDRLVRLVSENTYRSAGDILKVVFDEIDAWSKSREREDDQTLVVVKAGRAG